MTTIEENKLLTQTQAWPSRRQALSLLTAMVVLGIGIDLFFFNGFYASDDRAYFDAATHVVAKGHLSKTPRVGHERLTVMGWNIFSGWLSGYSIQVISASYTFFHGLLIVQTYLLAKRLFNPLAGILAAYTTATFPLFIIFSTGIYPDLLVACFFMLSLMAFIHAYDVRARGKFSAALLLMSASGVSIGIAYMAKEVGLVVLPVYFMIWLLTEWKRRPRKDAEMQAAPGASSITKTTADRRQGRWFLRSIVTGAFFAIGFFAMVGVEYVLLSHLTGRSYVRMLEREQEEDLEKVDNFHRDGGYNPIDRFKAAGRELGSGFLPENLKYLFGATLVVYPFIRRRNWSVYFLGLWIFAFLTVGTYSLKHYYPPRLQARYYIPALPFLITVFGITLAWLIGHLRKMKLPERPRRWFWGLISLAIILTPLAYFRGIDRWSGNLYRTDFVRNMARAINEATFEGAGKIVISRYFRYRIHQIWYRGMPPKPDARRPANVVVSSELLQIDFDTMLREGGFYYIDRPLVAEAPHTYLTVGSFDALLHPALSDGLPVRWQRNPGRLNGRPGIEPRFFVCTESIAPNLIEVNGYELTPELRTLYRHVFKTRTAEILCQLTNRQGLEDRFFSRASRRVLRYHIAARPIRSVTEDTRDLTPEVQPAKNDNNAPRLVGWNLSDESYVTLDHHRKDGFVLRVRTPNSDRARLEPIRDDSIPDVFLIPAHRRLWLTFDVEAEGSILAEAELRLYSGTDATKPMSSKSIKLTSGRNEVGLYTTDEARYLLPSFQLTGEGKFRIKKLQMDVFRTARRIGE